MQMNSVALIAEHGASYLQPWLRAIQEGTYKDVEDRREVFEGLKIPAEDGEAGAKFAQGVLAAIFSIVEGKDDDEINALCNWLGMQPEVQVRLEEVREGWKVFHQVCDALHPELDAFHAQVEAWKAQQNPMASIVKQITGQYPDGMEPTDPPEMSAELKVRAMEHKQGHDTFHEKFADLLFLPFKTTE